MERQSVSCHFCVLFLPCLPLFDPSLISPASSPSPFSFHVVVVICMAVEVFRTINLPLCHVSELASSSSSSAQPSDSRSSSPSPAVCCSPPRLSRPPLLCKLGADGLLWGSMEIARLAPKKRAALICFKVKQVQSRFISADPSVTPPALAFNLGGESWTAVLF